MLLRSAGGVLRISKNFQKQINPIHHMMESGIRLTQQPGFLCPETYHFKEVNDPNQAI
jgi:cell division protein YceG involved in septum cleavage